MKLRRQTKCYLKKRVVNRGSDGEKYAAFSEECTEIKATIYSGAGQIVSGQMGNVQQYQKKMLYDEPFTVTNENGVETYWFKGGDFSMAAGDGVCIYAAPDKNPDYKISAIFPVGHLKVILEKI